MSISFLLLSSLESRTKASQHSNGSSSSLVSAAVACVSAWGKPEPLSLLLCGASTMEQLARRLVVGTAPESTPFHASLTEENTRGIMLNYDSILHCQRNTSLDRDVIDDVCSMGGQLLQ
mmetsp:Transcript_28584/g.60961  ORF Transcript_28584/g.60961 Transcript_28584/m.60961 type:complete len:119 (-) Transcript_28584:84-440(-)